MRGAFALDEVKGIGLVGGLVLAFIAASLYQLHSPIPVALVPIFVVAGLAVAALGWRGAIVTGALLFAILTVVVVIGRVTA